MFQYEGPAVIGGVEFPDVTLHEEREPWSDIGMQRMWQGTATVPAAAAPPLFGMPNTPTLEVQLPDGRIGRACASARYDNGRWTLEITGEGPAPRCCPEDCPCDGTSCPGCIHPTCRPCDTQERPAHAGSR